MKWYFPLIISLLSAISSHAQMDVPPNGFNPKATISEEVGITSITITYSRPGVKGREGKIWGGVVADGFDHFNFIDKGLSSPWRAGANAATTIAFEHDVKVEGKDLKAGKYALFMAMDVDHVTLIFSNQVDAWGSYNYQESDDILRVQVKPKVLDQSVEWLKYEFVEHQEKSCVIAMQWEHKSVPFRVEVDVDKIVLARMREEFKGVKGFISANRLHAALYCFDKEVNMAEALSWAQMAISGKPFGQSTFDAYDILAQGYEKLGRTQDADKTIDEGLCIASLDQFLNYASKLSRQKRSDRAIKIVHEARDKFGDSFDVNVGLSHAYSTKGDFRAALKYANKALSQASEKQAESIRKDIANLKKQQNFDP